MEGLKKQLGYEDFGFDQNVLKQALEDTIENMPKIKKY